MRWFVMIRMVLLWALTFLVSAGLTHSVFSTYARLAVVMDIQTWLDAHRVVQYSVTVALALIFHTVALHLRLQPGSLKGVHQRGFGADSRRGFWLGVIWFVTLIVLLGLSLDRVVMNIGWIGYGVSTVMMMFIIVSAEHWIWRSWFYRELRKRLRLPTAIFVSALGLSIQQIWFFDLSGWTLFLAVFIQSTMTVWMVEYLGTSGTWIFLLMWSGSLHGLLGMPYLLREVASILFLDYTTTAKTPLLQQLGPVAALCFILIVVWSTYTGYRMLLKAPAQAADQDKPANA
jgi:hypothetical protein